MTSWVCEQSQGGQSSEALLFRWFLGSCWCSFQSPSWQAREHQWPLGLLLFLVPMFSQFLFRDPCSSKVLLLFLKKCFFYLGQAYRWAGRSSSPCLSLLCLVCLPWFLFVSLDWHVPESSHCAFFYYGYCSFTLWYIGSYQALIFPLSSSLEDLYLKLNDEFNQKLCDPAWIQI